MMAFFVVKPLSLFETRNVCHISDIYPRICVFQINFRQTEKCELKSKCWDNLNFGNPNQAIGI